MIAMYVEARGAHWLSGSSSLLTRCMFSNNTAEMPSDAPEKARTIIRKIKGINGFFNINLCSNVSKVAVLRGKVLQVHAKKDHVKKKSTTQDSIADKKTTCSSKCCMLKQDDNKKLKKQVNAASVDRTQYLQNA
jgi:hypothetical protein